MAVVLITGCSSGFGKLAALEFARRGDNVFASMRNIAKAGPLQDAAKAEKLEVSVVELDVTKTESANRAVKDVLDVTSRTQGVPGGRARVVHDRVFQRGRVVEDTLDWYAQDRKGNVWYFGEKTKELDSKGNVTSREGSWEAGVHGALAGVFMSAHPKVGQRFRQEYLKGHADDHFEIVAIHGNRMTTHEWTPLEPGVLDKKVYERGIGTTREASIKGGSEFLHLYGVEHR